MRQEDRAGHAGRRNNNHVNLEVYAGRSLHKGREHYARAAGRPLLGLACPGRRRGTTATSKPTPAHCGCKGTLGDSLDNVAHHYWAY